ncbi:MAG TPA: NADH-quinone oxidoreductase subunit NuoI [Chloroflexota bacterium]
MSVGQDVKGILAMVKGMWITLTFTRRSNLTVEYPEAKRSDVPRLRWRHNLHRYADGLERCIGCSLCAATCPAKAIYVEPAANTDEDRHSPGERYAKRYEINLLRCIYCGHCEEVCPAQAIVLGPVYELSSETRENLIYTKERLLVPETQGRGLPPTDGACMPPVQMDLK